MNNQISATERKHLGRVKELSCSVCGKPGPSFAHHIKQHQQYTAVALCYECHQGGNGWHGSKAIWRIHKMDELDALNETIRKLL